MKKLTTILAIALLFGCNCDPCNPDEEDATEDTLEDAVEENEDDGVVEDSVEDVVDEDVTEDSVDEDSVDDVVEESDIVSSCMNDSECNEWCIDHEGRAGGGCFEFVDEETGICTCPAARSECECYD